ncbi:MAG TPA: hypothetical protein PKM65_04535 [Spirochaetota bacterium]|nr:hypothetical protein [Spirochaetota bacterium]HNT10652.1 hypothetical protein [Spirochaetota bacterium]HNV48820.1 hypothetical protein [Spirochaetota bacterium]HOS38454.1 hypothetical protein [Spirochaetota bacterium]HPU89591.1 hypothetical protein [Spirochaetota bacterium]
MIAKKKLKLDRPKEGTASVRLYTNDPADPVVELKVRNRVMP